jgi:hypothetical protein
MREFDLVGQESHLDDIQYSDYRHRRRGTIGCPEWLKFQNH